MGRLTVAARRLGLDHLPAEQAAVRIELIANPSILSLTKREADIAIIMECPTLGSLASRKLCDYEYGLYCSRSYLQSHDNIAAPLNTDRHFVVGYIPDYLPHRDADLQVSNILTQVDATCQELGVALLPCFIANNHPELVRLLTRDISFVRSY